MSTAHDPKSLGKVTVANAGTPVAVKASSFHVKGVTFQSDPLNAGTYMIIKDAAGNIMAKITKGQSFTPPILGSADLNNIQLDTDTNGDGCFVTFV
jgi:hypothetical protein